MLQVFFSIIIVKIATKISAKIRIQASLLSMIVLSLLLPWIPEYFGLSDKAALYLFCKENI